MTGDAGPYVALADAKEAGYAVTDDFARRWLTAEAVLNGRLRDSWDQRYNSAQHQREAERAVERARDAFVQSLKSMPDREATLDRMAVSAAVRGTSAPPPETPPNYGDMTDAEFALERKKVGA